MANRNQSQDEPTRSIELRSAVALLLMLAGVVLVPLGVGMIAGLGAAIVTVGTLMLAFGFAIEKL